MKFQADDIARITFPKSLRGYSEEDVDDFIKKIRADYRDYNNMLADKDKEFEEREKFFLEQHKENRAKFDQQLQELQRQVDSDKYTMEQQRQEIHNLSTSSSDNQQVQTQLNQVTSELNQERQISAGLRNEIASFRAQLEQAQAAQNQGASQLGQLQQMNQELENLRREKQELEFKVSDQALQLRNASNLAASQAQEAGQTALLSANNQLADLRNQLASREMEIQNLRANQISQPLSVPGLDSTEVLTLRNKVDQLQRELDARNSQLDHEKADQAQKVPTEIATILDNVQSLANSILLDANKEKERLLQETQETIRKVQAETEQRKEAILRSVEDERRAANSELAVVNEQAQKKAAELLSAQERLRDLSVQVEAMRQSRITSQNELFQINEQTKKFKEDLINRYSSAINELKQ